MGCGEIYFADDEFQKSRLWKLRRNVAHAVKSQSIYKEEDTVVPRAFLPELLETVKAVGQKYGFESVCYGHAGDGNLHVNILKGELTQEQWTNEVPKGIREIFYRVKQLGGTISGEHGIGWVQKPYMDIMFDPYHLSLFSSIKKVFDPNNILNPSKIVPLFKTVLCCHKPNLLRRLSQVRYIPFRSIQGLQPPSKSLVLGGLPMKFQCQIERL